MISDAVQGVYLLAPNMFLGRHSTGFLRPQETRSPAGTWSPSEAYPGGAPGCWEICTLPPHCPSTCGFVLRSCALVRFCDPTLPAVLTSGPVEIWWGAFTEERAVWRPRCPLWHPGRSFACVSKSGSCILILVSSSFCGYCDSSIYSYLGL